MNVFIIGVAHKDSSQLLASPHIEKEFELLGISPKKIIASDENQLNSALNEAVMQGGLVLCPMTNEIQIDRLLCKGLAKICGKEMVLEEDIFAKIADKNVKLTKEEITTLATLPKDAKIFEENAGNFLGNNFLPFKLKGENINAVLLPADAAEQCDIFLNSIFPVFAKQPIYSTVSHNLRIMELSYKEVEGALRDVLSSKNPCVGVYEGKSEVIVRISVRGKNPQESAEICKETAKNIAERFRNYIYAIDLPNIETALVKKAEKKQLNFSVMEYGTQNCCKKRFEKVQNSKVRISYAKEIPTILKEKFGAVSAQTAASTAVSLADENNIGISLNLPTAQEKSSSAFIAAGFKGQVLVQEIPLYDFKNIHQLSNACVSQALNLARKFAEAFPALPKGTMTAPTVQIQKFSAPTPKEEISSMNEKNKSVPEKKKSLPKRILSAIFPNREDSTSDKIRKIGIILCLGVFCGSTAYLMDHHQQGVEAGKTNDKFNDLLSKAEQGDFSDFEIDQEKLDKVALEVLDKYKPFVAINDDMQGWIKIEGTKINYPVVQADDNEYYHRLSFEQEYDYYGVPYLDYECHMDVDAEKCSDNMIIYGHNIGNDGLMFNPLSYYKQLNFYKEHPVVRFDGIYKEQEYKIFGVMVVNAKPEQDNGNVFKYWQQVDFDTDAEFNAYVDEVRRRSMWDIDVDVEPGDNLLTLSTCTYDFKPEARVVIVARAIREGESSEVDTSTAVINSDAYFPKAYYDAKNEQAKYGHVKSVSIEGQDYYEIEVGQTLQLKAVTNPSDAPINTVTWDSSSSAVATVDKTKGLVTAVSPGEVNITANADDGGYADTVKVKVKAVNALKKLYFANNYYELTQGEQTKLTVKAEPADAELKLEWSIENSPISYNVSKSNQRELNVNALEAFDGTVLVTVKDVNTGISAQCEIAVKPAVTMQLSTTDISYNQGEKAYVTLTVQPYEELEKLKVYTENGIVEYFSSENADGSITFTVSGGENGDKDIIYFQIGNLIRKCAVTVTQNEIITVTPATLNLVVGEEYTLEVEGSLTGKYTFTSKDENIAVVSSKGKVTAVEEGNTKIVVKGSAGATVEVAVYVTAKEEPKVEEKLTVTPPDGKLIVGTNYTLEVNGSLDGNYKFISGNDDIATVDEDGVITAVGAGKVTITITTQNGSSTTVTIEVVEAEPPKEEQPKEETPPPKQEPTTTPNTPSTETPDEDGEDENQGNGGDGSEESNNQGTGAETIQPETPSNGTGTDGTQTPSNGTGTDGTQTNPDGTQTGTEGTNSASDEDDENADNGETEIEGE